MSSNSKRPQYTYRATVTSVYDGDTCTVEIDLGLNVWVKNEKIRLARINTPEIRGDERETGLISRDYLRELIQDKDVIIQTLKDKKGKYGRYLGEIWIELEGEWVNVNDKLVEEEGLGIYQEY